VRARARRRRPARAADEACAGTKDKLLEEGVRRALDTAVLAALHPRTLILVVVQVLHDDGAVSARARARA
jgi:ribonuclease PH